MLSQLKPFLIFASLALPVLALAQAKVSQKNLKGVVVQTYKAQLEIDKKETADYKENAALFRTAYLNKEEVITNELKNKLLSLMRRELAQSQAKIEQDKETYEHSKKEYNLAKKRTKISKEDYKLSKDDKADKKAYKNDNTAEKKDKRIVKDFRKAYTSQKRLSKKMEKIIDKLELYSFTFNEESEKENKKKKDLIFDFLKLMQDDIKATKDDINY